jgi:hypothetical protein
VERGLALQAAGHGNDFDVEKVTGQFQHQFEAVHLRHDNIGVEDFIVSD